MPPRTYKSITVHHTTYEKLLELKRKWGLDSIPEVIQLLLEKCGEA